MRLHHKRVVEEHVSGGSLGRVPVTFNTFPICFYHNAHAQLILLYEHQNCTVYVAIVVRLQTQS